VLTTLPIKYGAEYAPYGGAQHPDQAKNTYDNDSSTYWRTNSFVQGPEFAPSVKKGVGLIYDLGSDQEVNAASIDLFYGGDHTTVELFAADSWTTSTPPSDLTKLASAQTSTKTAKLTLKSTAKTRYVVVWLTALPHSEKDGYYSAGYKQAITDVIFSR
jgi:hypothetical protein